MAILDPKALVAARGKKGWTQLQLSEATKPRINTSTISRIERGKPKRVRDHTLRQLSSALEVERETLCQQPEPQREVVKLRIEAAARNALTLVALRYRISREQIVAVAPLLFFIAAEKSLQERQKRLGEIRDAADGLVDLQVGIQHFPRPIYPVDERPLSCEEQSIKARDLFGTIVDDAAGQYSNGYDTEYEEAEHNPFAVFLQDALAQVSSAREEQEPIRWLSGFSPSYEICAEEAAVLVGGDTKAILAILRGAAPLHEMPKGTPDERAKWACARWEREWGDLDSLLEDLGRQEPAGDSAADATEGDAT